MFVQNINSNDLLGDYSLWISEMNDRQCYRGWTEEWVILCYKVGILPLKWSGALFDSGHRLYKLYTVKFRSSSKNKNKHNRYAKRREKTES